MKSYSLLTSLTLLLASHWVSAETVPVYLEPQTPDAYWQDMDREALAAARPQPLAYNNQVVPGWYWVRQTGVFAGYVRSADVGKDLTVRSNAIIFARASSESPALGTASGGATVEITETGADWVTVRYQGPVAYYFEDRTKAVPQPVTASVVETDVTLSEIEILEPEGAAGGDAQAQPGVIVIFEGGSISGVADGPEYIDPMLPTLDELSIQPQRPPAPITRALSPEVARAYQGKLVRLGTLARMTSGHEYALLGVDGERIAYVEPEKALIFEPLTSFLDQDVVIQGKAYPGSGTGGLVLEVEFMRLRH